MELDLSGPMIATYKARAKDLRAGTPVGQTLTQSQALERIARETGARDWNTLRAQIAKPLQIAPGMRVTGTYLSQPFEGQVHAVSLLSRPDQLRVTLHFDEAVDVVQFHSFSAFRRRVTAVVGTDGRSIQTTSDGEPHLVLTSAHK